MTVYWQPSTVISASVAAILMDRAGLDVFRVQNRGKNPRLDQELDNLAVLAAGWRDAGSAAGTRARGKEGVSEDSDRRMVTAEAAADLLGMSVRGVTKACHDGRLPAEKVGRQWFANRLDIREFNERRNRG